MGEVGPQRVPKHEGWTIAREKSLRTLGQNSESQEGDRSLAMCCQQ